MKNFACQTLVMFCLMVPSAFSANLVERVGAYEINWTSGKIRFYGVGKLADGEQNLRAAEQRAWADGLKLAEKNIPVLLNGRMGSSQKEAAEKVSKLAQLTTSVSTTYFGDHRVKVLLEAPISKVVPQIIGDSHFSQPSAEPVGFVLRVPSGAKPSAVLQIVDEKGHELLRAPSPRWFKGTAPQNESGLAADSPILSATMLSQGIMKVAASDWQAGFGSAIVGGRAAVVVQ